MSRFEYRDGLILRDRKEVAFKLVAVGGGEFFVKPCKYFLGEDFNRLDSLIARGVLASPQLDSRKKKYVVRNLPPDALVSEERYAWVVQEIGRALFDDDPTERLVKEFLRRISDQGPVLFSLSRYEWTSRRGRHVLRPSLCAVEKTCTVIGEPIDRSSAEFAALEILDRLTEEGSTAHRPDDWIFRRRNDALDLLEKHGWLKREADDAGSYFLKTPEVIADERRIAGALAEIARRALPSAGVHVYGSLNEEQASAVRTILGSRISVLCGYAGTGKTQVLRTVLSALPCSATFTPSHTSRRVLSARCADILNSPVEVVQYAPYMFDKCTTNRALDFFEGLNIKKTERNDLVGWDNCRTLVAEEAGMMSLHDVAELLRLAVARFPLLGRVVFCGDPRQLKSVGPGRVLDDLIECGLFPVAELRTNERTEGGELNENARRILRGEPVVCDNSFLLDVSDDTSVAGHARLRVASAVASDFRDASRAGRRNVRILAYTNKEVTFINEAIRKYLFPGSQKGLFEVGMKLIVTKRYPLGGRDGEDEEGGEDKEGNVLWKGDLYEVLNVFRSREIWYLKIRPWSGGEALSLPVSRARDVLDLGYATTVHKMQGGESDEIWVHARRDNCRFFDCEALYTAVTRARRTLKIYAPEGAGDLHSIIQHRNDPRVSTMARLLIKKMEERGVKRSKTGD